MLPKVLLTVFALVTALLPAGGAGAQAGGQFLLPLPGTIFSGEMHAEVRYEQLGAQAVEFVLRWNDGQRTNEALLGRDTDPFAVTEHGRIPEDRTVRGRWSAALQLPEDFAGAFLAQLVARTESCDMYGCAMRDIAAVEVRADATPPEPVIVAPAHGKKIPVGSTVAIEVEITDPAADFAEAFLQALFPSGKGLPKLDQHVVGATLSGDLDDDDKKGDMSCAPTAAGSSLAWFAAGEFPQLLPTGKTQEDLVKDLGARAGTDDNGTAPADLIKAIDEVIAAAGLKDELKAHSWKQDATSLDDIETEYAKGQDVLLGLYWKTGGAHRVAVEGMTRRADGSATITIMDPWTGSYETIEVDKDGNAKQGDAELDIRRMIHVSPVKPAETKVGTATATPATGPGEGSRATITWDTTGVEPGDYVLHVTGTDTDGVTMHDYSVISVTAAPGFDSDPSTDERLDAGTGTAAALQASRARFPEGGAQHAVLARDDDFADSLGASGLTRDGPLVYTRTAELTAEARAELVRAVRAGGKVYLLGGTEALSDAVATGVREAGFEPVRLSGPSRIETALAAASELLRLNPQVRVVVLARAFGSATDATAGWADSVTGGAWAADRQVPLALTGSDELHPRVADWLRANDIAATVLLGGDGALSSAVEGAVPGPLRMAGATRDGTAAAIATQLWAQPAEGARRYIVVNGYRPDGWSFGLAAAGLAADADAPVLLVAPETTPQATLDLARSCGEPRVDVLALGDPSVVAPERLADLAAVDGADC